MEQENTTSESPKKSSHGIGTIVVIVIVALVIVAAIVGYGVVNSQKNNSATQVPATPTPDAMKMEDNTTMTTPSEAVDAMSGPITVTGANFSFNPNTITVKKGEKVTITFKSSGGFHDFVIDELNVKTPVIASGKDATVTFTPTKAGTYEYYCSVGNHRAMGMVGKLIVQ